MIDIIYPDDTNSIFVRFEGTYKYISVSNQQYKDFLGRLKRIYQRKYQSYSHIKEIPLPDKVLELIRTSSELRGYKFDVVNDQTLYCVIYRSRNNHKMIGKKFLDEFLSDPALNYSFCGITDINRITNIYPDMTCKRIVSSNFIDLTSLFELVLKSDDAAFDLGGFNYAIHYMLNSHPEKLDFLINDIK